MEIGNRDLDKIDPDWRFAYFHAKSTKPGICTDEKPELCDCCLNIIHKEPVDIGIHTKELEFMGFGFPLWFSFLKYCIILTIILIISEASVSVYQAIHMNKELCIQQYQRYNSFLHPSQGINNTSVHSPQSHPVHFIGLHRVFDHSSQHLSEQKPHSESNKEGGGHGQSKKNDSLLQKNGHEGKEHGVHCTGIFILLSRIDAQIDDFEAMLRISTFIIIMFTLLFIRDTIYKTQQYYDERRCSLGDYSVMISKLPNVDGIQGMVRRFFNEGLSQPYPIEEMILVPGLEELEEVQHEKDHHIKDLQKLYKKGKQEHEHEIQEIEKEVEQLQERESEAVRIFKEQLEADKLHSEKVIVVLSTEPQKQRFLQDFEALKDEQDFDKLIEFFGPQGIEIEMEEAPQPREIIWENFNYPTSKRFGRILLGWGLSILFIAAITVVFYFILKWKTHVVEEKENVTDATIIVFVALVLVILFNKFVMGNVLHHFTHIEKHATSDNDQFSFAFKYAMGMFFTTALMTLFVEAITYNNFYKHHYGVIEQQSIMFFMNSLLVPIIWAINPFQIVVLIKRKLSFGKKHLTQREANHLMEDFQYDVGKRYAEILESMWFTFLYASLIPMGAFLTAIGIGLYYWVDKYNLLRRSSLKQNVSGSLSISALTLLDLVLVFFPLGQIIFDYFLRNHVNTSSIVMLVISIIYIILPLNSIIDFFNKENFYLEEKEYRDVKDTFKDNYFNLHPMYSKINPEQNTQSRRLYKETVMKQFGNPVFSFAMGWLMGKNGLNPSSSGVRPGTMNRTQSNSRVQRNDLIQDGQNLYPVKHMHHVNV